jgi:hypothetical protein
LDTLGVTKSSAEDEARQTLVSVTLDVIDSKNLAVGDLLKLRNDKTKFAAELGQNYAQAVEKQVAQLTNPTFSATDTRAVVEDFRRAMQQDLGRLYDELKLGAVKTLLSKEATVAIAAPLAGAPR